MFRSFWACFLLILVSQAGLAYEEYSPTYKNIQTEFVLKEPFGNVIVSVEVDDFSSLKIVRIKYQSKMTKFVPGAEGKKFPKTDLNQMEILVGHDIGGWLKRKDQADSDPEVSHFSICLPYGEYYEAKNGWIRDVLEIKVEPENYSVLINSQRQGEMGKNGSCF